MDKKFSSRKILFVLVLLIFAWSIWNAFLKDIIPRYRTYFLSYNSFLEKTECGMFLAQLPKSANNVKYYSGTDRFVNVRGYGASFSDFEYKETQSKILEQYNLKSEKGASNRKTYLLTDNNKNYVSGKWLEENKISKATLNLTNKIEDYYILSYDYIDNSSFTYFTCAICNDRDKRIIEIECRNKNATNNNSI